MRWKQFLVAGAVAALVGAPGAGAQARTLAPKAGPGDTTNIVATARHQTVQLWRSPHARHPYTRLQNTLNPGGPLVFLVRARANGWEQVYLPVRPNDSTAWVRDRDVTLAWNPYVVELSLNDHFVTVWKGQRLVDHEKAGVGRSVLPTPRGTYYIVALLKQSNPNGAYGPYAFGLSAYSNVLQSFGGGPGEIGLHGTDYPQGLGTDVSHGCIRVSNAAISRLARILPLGTPVIIGA